MAPREQKSIGWLEICTALFFCLAILTVVWVIFRAPVGLLYRAARMAETVGMVLEPTTPDVLIAPEGQEQEVATRFARIGFA